jgi:hypothetical protein
VTARWFRAAVPWAPLAIGIVALVALPLLVMLRTPAFVDLDPLEGNPNEAQKQTISITVELNKYLISLATLTFGAFGFFLTYYKAAARLPATVITFLLALVLLGSTYYFAFRAYSELTAELAQDALAMKPERSLILYYIELEFWAFLGASMTMFGVFMAAVFGPSQEGDYS